MHTPDAICGDTSSLNCFTKVVIGLAGSRVMGKGILGPGTKSGAEC